MKKVRAIRGEIKDQIDWVHEAMATGFSSYEVLVKKVGGKYSVGDGVTMADVCLVPAWGMAVGYKLDLKPYPTIQRICNALAEVDAFRKESWAVKGEENWEGKIALEG